MSLHHVLGRVLNGSVHARPLQFRRIPFSPSILQRLRLRPQPRFFTSTAPKSRGRPYPHRAYYDYQKPPFLGFLDRIPQNAVFWGIITINGVVFVMWFLTKQRMVRRHLTLLRSVPSHDSSDVRRRASAIHLDA